MEVKRKLNVHSGIILLFLLRVNFIQAQQFYLPNNVRPENYELLIYTDLNSSDNENFPYWGYVQIEVTCTENTNQIVLNSKELTILEDEVTVIATVDNTPVVVSRHDYTTEYDFYTITVNEPLAAENVYLVYIPFQATLRNDTTGYYKSSYVDEQTGETRWTAFSHFPSLYARNAFPCFDQLDMMATFTITLAHAENLSALSNMPLLNRRVEYDESTQMNWVFDQFEQSVRMCTQHVALMVSDFVGKEILKPESNVAVSVWSRPDKFDQTDLALEVAANALQYFGQYFGIPYALCKLDVVAIKELWLSSLDNYGLISFRESRIIFNPQEDSAINEFLVYRAMCHEIFHQWVGNLITIASWDVLWLSEGFATYYEYVTASKLSEIPEALDFVAVIIYLSVTSADSTKDAQPVSQPITDLSQITQIFNLNAFAKGSHLVRMLILFLEEEVFLSGYLPFLETYKFSNVVFDDLWNALTDAAQEAGALPNDLTLKEIMEPWLLQAGSPLVSVTIEYGTKTARITLTQKRFFQITEDENNDTTCWVLPITYATSREPNFDKVTPYDWLTCDGPLNLEVEITDNEWIIFNLKLLVLCRINFEERNWQLIRDSLLNPDEYAKIDVLSRVQVITDVIELSKAGLMDYSFAFDIFVYIKIEENYLPWRAVLPAIVFFHPYFLGTDIYVPFQNYVKDLFEQKFADFGPINQNPDDYIQFQFKIRLIEAACLFDVGDCRTQCPEIFNQWFTDPNPDESNPILIDFRPTVYCYAVKSGNVEYWNFLWLRLPNVKTSTEKDNVLTALACSEDSEILKTLLDRSIDPNQNLQSDSPTIYSNLSNSDIGYAEMKDFLINRFQDIYNFHNGDSWNIEQYFEGIFQITTKRADLDELVNFVNTISNQFADLKLDLESSISTATTNVNWYENNEPVFVKIFQG